MTQPQRRRTAKGLWEPPGASWARERFSTRVYQHPDFGRLTTRIERGRTSVALRHWLCSDLLRQPQETNTQTVTSKAMLILQIYRIHQVFQLYLILDVFWMIKKLYSSTDKRMSPYFLWQVSFSRPFHSSTFSHHGECTPRQRAIITPVPWVKWVLVLASIPCSGLQLMLTLLLLLPANIRLRCSLLSVPPSSAARASKGVMEWKISQNFGKKG